MFINKLARGSRQGVHLSQVHRTIYTYIYKAFFFVGALETSAPPTPPPNGYKSKYFVRNNIYLLVIVNHCANVYLGVWKKNIHNFAQKHTNV